MRACGVTVMLCVEFPNGSQIDFESPEALANAIQHMRAGTPLIVRDQKDGSRAVLWAPGGRGLTSLCTMQECVHRAMLI